MILKPQEFFEEEGNRKKIKSSEVQGGYIP